MVAVTTREQARSGREQHENSSPLKPEVSEQEELHLHPHHVLDEETEEHWKNIIDVMIRILCHQIGPEVPQESVSLIAL